MKNIKRISAFIFAVILLLCLCACGKKEEAAAESETAVQESAVESAAAETKENTETKTVVTPEVMNTKQFNCVVNSADGLTLRLGPGVSYDSVTVIPDETPLVELANQNGWIFVEYEGAQGWVFGQCITYSEQ